MASSTTREPDGEIVEFPQPDNAPEERARRLRAEVERLGRLPEVEWRYYIIDGDTAENYGVTKPELTKMVEATIRANEKAAREDKAADRRQERHAERCQDKARQEEIRARQEQEREEKRARQEQERVDKSAAKKQKDKDRAFAKLIDLPSIEHEARLAELAKCLCEHLEQLRDEFADFVTTEDSIKRSKDAEPWEEAVSTQALLTELTAQLRRYVVMHDDVAMTVSLWTMFAWIHEIAVHSPILIVTSAEPDSGKSTLLGALSLLVPRPYSVVEVTGANIYHIVDRLRPTLIIDEADMLFSRKPALTEVINAGWTPGAKIPRIMHGTLHQFDPFCPKIIGMKGLALPDTTATRGIVVKLWPKLPGEKVADFAFTDDADFVVLRRKLVRWSADNAAGLKNARPALPAGMSNRLAANWRLLFAIADLVGGAFPKQARTAAVKLSRKRHRLSEGLRLLAALSPMLVDREVITSAEVVKQLAADKNDEWGEFRGHGPVTQRQVAALLEQYDVSPSVVHPGKRASESARGYKCAELRAAIARLLPSDPYIRTLKGKKPR